MSIYVNQPLARGEPPADRHLYLRAPELDQGAARILSAAQRIKSQACTVLCSEDLPNIQLIDATAHIILLLSLNVSMTIAQIESESGLPRPSLSRHLRQLEAVGLIARSICRQDRRQRRISLAGPGEALGLKAASVWRKMLTEAYLSAGPEGVQGTRKVLAGLADYPKREGR